MRAEHHVRVGLRLEEPRKDERAVVVQLDRLLLQTRVVPEPLRMADPAPRLRPLHVLRRGRQQAPALQQSVDGEEQFRLGSAPGPLDRGDRLLAVPEPVAQLLLAQPGPLPGDLDLPAEGAEQVRDLIGAIRLAARGDPRARLRRHAAPPPCFPVPGDEPTTARPGHGRTPVHPTVRTGTVTLRTARSTAHGRTYRSRSVR